MPPPRSESKLGHYQLVDFRETTMVDLLVCSDGSVICAKTITGLLGFSSRIEQALKGWNFQPVTDPAYQAARATSQRIAGRDGIDAMLNANHLDALVSPTMAPAWKIDAANGDQIGGAGAGGLAAVAGYPHLTVPMGAVMNLPVGLSIIGPAWSEARLLAYGYAYEQAAKVTVTPRFLPSIEGAAPVAPLLEPLQR